MRRIPRRAAALGAVLAMALVACTSTPEPTPSPSPVAAATAAATASSSPSPSPTPEGPLPDGPVTALVLGTDSRDPASYEGNADAIVVVQLSADRRTLSLISVTRDSWVAIPGHGEAKINASFALGGTELAVATVSELFGGLEIDYVAQTNFAGLVSIIDAVGGFEVDNRTPSIGRFSSSGEASSGGIAYDFTADPMALVDGEGILFLRQRYGLPNGDLDRAERTRAALVGLLERLDELADDPVALAAALAGVAAVVRITGDLAADDLVALVDVARGLGRDDILSLQAPLAGFTGVAGASVNVVDETGTASLGDALREGDVRGWVEDRGVDAAP